MPRLLLTLFVACLLTTAPGQAQQPVDVAVPEIAALVQLQRLKIPTEATRHVRLEKGQTIEISLRIEQPSTLPVDGRLRASWELVQADQAADIPRAGNEDPPARPLDALGIYTSPTANWSNSGWGTSGGAAVTMIASKGASSGQPLYPSPTRT